MTSSRTCSVSNSLRRATARTISERSLNNQELSYSASTAAVAAPSWLSRCATAHARVVRSSAMVVQPLPSSSLTWTSSVWLSCSTRTRCRELASSRNCRDLLPAGASGATKEVQRPRLVCGRRTGPRRRAQPARCEALRSRRSPGHGTSAGGHAVEHVDLTWRHADGQRQRIAVLDQVEREERTALRLASDKVGNARRDSWTGSEREPRAERRRPVDGDQRRREQLVELGNSRRPLGRRQRACIGRPIGVHASTVSLYPG